jgi:hypothetical protein
MLNTYHTWSYAMLFRRCARLVKQGGDAAEIMALRAEMARRDAK